MREKGHKEVHMGRLEKERDVHFSPSCQAPRSRVSSIGSGKAICPGHFFSCSLYSEDFDY